MFQELNDYLTLQEEMHKEIIDILNLMKNKLDAIARMILEEENKQKIFEKNFKI